MLIDRNTVVTLTYELSDTQGQVLEASDKPFSYLHGGYSGIFPALEDALQGQDSGATLDLALEPGDAFGEYDAELVRIEERERFPDGIEIGMQFEGQGDESGDMRVYTVTDLTADRVVVDGNHPLAGQSLKVTCTVHDVRAATQDEITHGHAHGPHGHHHH
jgi:FKBP-type peptidyl-prolyl cis-trans isomerase SlyD